MGNQLNNTHLHLANTTTPCEQPPMTRTTFTLLVSAFLLAFVFTARAQSSLWVRTGGCDTATCGSPCNGTFACQLATIDCGGRPGFTVENGNAIIAGVIVNNCQRPGGNGGAFYTRYANIALQAVKVTNSGADKGAAFYLENGSGTIARSYFTSNTATTTGGGIYVTGAQLDLIESNMTGNSPNDIACAGAAINQPRPAIETGEVECLGGCNSPLCSA